MTRVAPFAPASRSPVNRPPHQQTIGKEFVEESNDVFGNPFDRLRRAALLIVWIEEVVVRDVADRDIGGGAAIRDSDLSDKGMSRRKDRDWIRRLTQCESTILEARNQHRHENVANRHARAGASVGLA